MSNDNRPDPQARPESDATSACSDAIDPAETPSTTDTCQDYCQGDKCQEISGTWNSPFVDNGEMSKKPKGGSPSSKELTTELRRFIWLVAHLKDSHGIGQAEMARRTGIDSSHINRLANAETHGYTGLSADIVRKVRDGLNISTDYFFDQYEGQRPAIPLYSLDQKRREAWNNTVEDRLAALEQSQAQAAARTAQLEASVHQKDAEIERLKHELTLATRAKKQR